MSKKPQRVSIKLLGNPYSRHPDNRFGQGSPDFWEAEYKLWGLDRQTYHRIHKEQSPKCGICGTPFGYSWGTGDCGCGDEY